MTYGQAQDARVLISAVKSFIVEVTMKDFEWKKKVFPEILSNGVFKRNQKESKIRFFFSKSSTFRET